MSSSVEQIASRAEPLYGWRSAGLVGLVGRDGQVSKLAFRSVNRSDLFGFRAEAFCRDHNHPAPNPNCRCGFYSLKSRSRIVEGRYDGVDDIPGEVLLHVALAGEVIEGEDGYRAAIQIVESVEVHPLCAAPGCEARTRWLRPGTIEAINQEGRWMALIPVCEHHATAYVDAEDFGPAGEAHHRPITVADAARLAPVPVTLRPETTRISIAQDISNLVDSTFRWTGVTTVLGAIAAALTFIANQPTGGGGGGWPRLWPTILTAAAVATAGAMAQYLGYRNHLVHRQMPLEVVPAAVAAATAGGAVAGWETLRMGGKWVSAVGLGAATTGAVLLAGVFVTYLLILTADRINVHIVAASPFVLGAAYLAATVAALASLLTPPPNLATLEEAQALAETPETAAELPVGTEATSIPGELAKRSEQGETVELYWLSPDGNECWRLPIGGEPERAGDTGEASGGRMLCGPEIFAKPAPAADTQVKPVIRTP